MRPGAGPAPVEVLFDGQPLTTLACTPRWQRLSFEVPARLATLGRHRLDLRPRDPVEPGPGAPDPAGRRPLAVAVRRLLLDPAAEPAAPWIDRRGLHLPPGTAAAWSFWVPPGARLRAEPGRVAATFTVQTDDGPPRELRGPQLVELAGRPVRLVASAPAGAARPVRLRRLLLVADPPPAPAPAAAGKALLVVGGLSAGFTVSPCSTDPELALACLLSGREAAAFGLELPAAFDHVGDDATATAAFLAAAPPPATAALVLRAGPARTAAEELARRLPGLEVLLASLPATADDFAVLAATVAPARQPVNARDLDLTATVLAAAGAPAETLDGIDLRAVLGGTAPATVRPAAAIWLADRAVAVVGERRWDLATGPVPPAASVLEACALGFLERRRRTLRWLAPARPGPPLPPAAVPAVGGRAAASR